MPPPNDAAADIRILEAYEPQVGPAAADPPFDWPVEIQKRYFRSRRGGHTAFVGNPIDLTKLSKDERRILELLCADDLGAHWGHAGMPPDIRSRRRILGLDPPSILEDLIPCATLGKGMHPRWKVLKAALDKYSKSVGNKPNSPPAQEWIAKHYFDLAPAQWLEVWTEVAARAYGLIGGFVDDPLATAVARASKQDRDSWAVRWTTEIPRSPERRLRSLLLEHIVDAYTAQGEKPPAHVAAITKIKSAKPAPKPKPAPPPPKIAPGAYVFFGRKSYGVATVDKLDVATRKQFLAAAQKYAGKAFRTPATFFAWQAKELEIAASCVEAVHWKIALAGDKKRAMYEMWTFEVDNGTVFEAGTAKLTGISMFQGRFVAEDKRGNVVRAGKQPPLEALARELQANVPF